MNAKKSPLAVMRTGLVTSVGLSTAAACAAIRAKLTNPTITWFRDSVGEPITAHQVPLDQPWRGLTRLARMAAMAVAECLDGIPPETWGDIPLLLCVAERERPGRLAGLDDKLFQEMSSYLPASFATESAVIPHGRVSVAVALAQARKLIANGTPAVLIVGVDSLLTWPTLSVFLQEDRLLTRQNSNGFVPGEAAGALLLSGDDSSGTLVCAGLGFAREHANIRSGQPLRADGLTQAITKALNEAGRAPETMHARITDLSGEQFYFKEASLAFSRILRTRIEDFELSHPAECCGELGAASGAVCIAVAHVANEKGYAEGDGVLLHFSNDDGARAAVVGIGRQAS